MTRVAHDAALTASTAGASGRCQCTASEDGEMCGGSCGAGGLCGFCLVVCQAEKASSPLRDIYAEIAAERQRAHAKHGRTSMEALPVHDLTRLTVLLEEVGEVAREFNEARHRLTPDGSQCAGLDRAALRKELIQVAAMAAAWADAIEEAPCPS